jgi:peroxiredoxin
MKSISQYRTNKKHFSTSSIMLLAVLFVGSVIMTSCSKKEDDTPGDTTTFMAPAFALKSLTGDTITLASLQGKVAVLFFFGYGCPHCKESAPEIQSMLVNPYAGNDMVQVIGLDLWDGTEGNVTSFRDQTGVTFPLLLNASVVASEYGTSNDRLVVVDQQGNIRLRGNQAAQVDIPEIKAMVDMLLAQ